MAFLDETGLAELWTLIRAEDMKVATGSYKGTGTAGSSNANKITFGFVPKLLFVQMSGEPTYAIFFAYGLTTSYDSGYIYVYAQTARNGGSVKLDGTTLSWYVTGNVDMQLNESGKTYKWYAIG